MIVNKTKKNIQKKQEKTQVNVPTQWSFIKTCTHDTKSANCPMCKLIIRETESWIQAEKEKALHLRMVGFFSRAEMRYGLLVEWSKNQMSVMHKDTTSLQVAEVVLCGNFVEAMCTFEGGYGAIKTLNKILEKRMRIIEVGEFAAIYIQSKIRSVLCRMRVKAHMLQRFHFYHPAAKRGSYYLDKKDGQKWIHAPVFIRHERPASPRTISRRLKSQEDMRQFRHARNKKILAQQPKFSQNNIWEHTEQNIVYMRQIVVLRDVVLSLMKTMSLKRRESGEKTVLPRVVREKQTSDNSKTEESNERRRELSVAGPRGRGGASAVAMVYPYWFTLSNPCMPVRQLFLTLAIETDPLPPEASTLKSPDDTLKGLDSTSPEDGATLITAIAVEEELSLNDRLALLEERAWTQMECDSADELIEKLLACEEVQPSMSSVTQIAEDDHKVWVSKLDIANHNGITLRHVPNPDAKVTNDRDSYLEEGESPLISEVLPMQLQIYPFYCDRTPAGILRMFFIDGNIVAISHSSTWTYYAEIWKYRNGIVAAVESFAASDHIKHIVMTLLQKANATDSSSNSSCDAKLVTSRHNVDSNMSEEAPKQKSGDVVSVLLPDERNVFGSRPHIRPCRLTLSEYQSVEKKYKFLNKMSSWKASRRYCVSNKSNPLSSSEDISMNVQNAPVSHDSMSVKLSQMPVAEELLGTSVFRLSNQSVPGSSISSTTQQLMADSSGSSAYRSLLKKAVNCIDANMTLRIQPPIDNSYTSNVPHASLKPKTYDVAVIDVHVSVAIDRSNGLTVISPPTNSGRSSQLPAGQHPPNTKSTKTEPKIIVDLHHVVGVFSTSNERPPAGIDTALFSWNALCKLKLDSGNVELGQSSTTSRHDGSATGDTLSWNAVSVAAGIYSLKYPSKTVPNGVIQVRLIGHPPTREYIEANIPRKMRLWMGLKY